MCDKYKGVEYLEIPLNFPETHEEIVRKTEGVFKTYADAVGKRVRMVVVDSIASNPGYVPDAYASEMRGADRRFCSVIMPWERIVRLCRAHDALSLVDAAHHLGQLPVDLTSVQPDFWVSVGFFPAPV